MVVVLSYFVLTLRVCVPASRENTMSSNKSDSDTEELDDDGVDVVYPPAAALFVRVPARWRVRGRGERGAGVRRDVCDRVWEACVEAWDAMEQPHRRWAVVNRQRLFDHLGRAGMFPDVRFANVRVPTDAPEERNAPQNYGAPLWNPHSDDDGSEEHDSENEEQGQGFIADARLERRRRRDAHRRAQAARVAGFEPGKREVVQILVRCTHRTLNKRTFDRFARPLCAIERSHFPVSRNSDQTNDDMVRTILHVSHRELWEDDAIDFLNEETDRAALDVTRAAMRFIARSVRNRV